MNNPKVINFPTSKIVEFHAPEIKSIYEDYRDQIKRNQQFHQIITDLHEKMHKDDIDDFDPKAWRTMQWWVYLPLAFVIGLAVGMQ